MPNYGIPLSKSPRDVIPQNRSCQASLKFLLSLREKLLNETLMSGGPSIAFSATRLLRDPHR
jgi:hypothetical protein